MTVTLKSLCISSNLCGRNGAKRLLTFSWVTLFNAFIRASRGVPPSFSAGSGGTGYPGWMGILILIPVVNLIFLYFIAFADWPAEKAGGRIE